MIKETIFECMRNDLTIRGTEYRPEKMSEEEDKFPIAIVSHGFMNNQTNVCHYAKFLAQLGYAAYCFDFCGGSVDSLSDGKTTEMSVLTEIEDLRAVLTYTKELPYTNEKNILLMGCSQGGFVSAILASELKDEIAKLVMFYPAFCMPDAANAGKMVLATYNPKNIPDVMASGDMLIGKCYVETVMDMDPYAEVKDYQGDVLIIHGNADRLVDISYSERACAMYREQNADRQVALCIIEGGGHGFRLAQDELAMKRIEEFVWNG